MTRPQPSEADYAEATRFVDEQFLPNAHMTYGPLDRRDAINRAAVFEMLGRQDREWRERTRQIHAALARSAAHDAEALSVFETEKVG